MYGNIPANWLGNGRPANHITANARNGYLIDNLVLELAGSSATPAPTPSQTPSSTPTPEPPADSGNRVDLATPSTYLGSSDNWVNTTRARAYDGNNNNIARTQNGERGANSNPVWIDFNLAARYSSLQITLKEDNSNPLQVSRWKVQSRTNASSAWVNLPAAWEASSSANEQSYPVPASLVATQIRVLLQAPNAQTVGVQEINITGIRQ